MAHSVVVAEDHHLTRMGMRSILEDQLDIDVGAMTDDGLQVLPLLREHDPDLLVLDLGLRHLNGLTILRTIQEQGIPVKMVVFSMYDDLLSVRQAFELGASGYVLKGAPMRELKAAVNAVLAGEKFLCSELPQDALEPPDEDTDDGPDSAYETLTRREREVLELSAEGYTSHEIGKLLYISHRTVEKHRENVKKKLGLRNLVEMADYAHEHGLISQTPPLNDEGSGSGEE